ncbi:fibronectin type III domain-containing protein [Sphingomonas sp. R1]|uniref:fibronectin type III domain-containing protein n=1 Tax=Sphingomonas sp. R1 TaxID=399176 RepID=UPI0022240879|nr:fibronectin type III domain-containing protein [Sphingomonas sp. R1]UYY77811.1 fibronectin type III domain-containing protein [Sphingomonas sp. R1]
MSFGFGIGPIGGGGGVAVRSVNVPAGSTGRVVNLVRLLGSASTFSLLSGTDASITLNGGDGLALGSGLAAGVSVIAQVREQVGSGATARAVEYAVKCTGAPAVPSLPAVTLTAGNGQISVAWTDGSNGGSAISSHNIYVNGALVSSPTGASPYVITGLTNGISYSVRVSAVNGIGEGALSTAQSATPVAVAPAPNVTLPVTSGLVARYNANYSTISQANGRVTSVSDLSGNGYTAGDNNEGLGPQLVTYASGLKALRFNQDSFLSNPSTPSMGPLASTIIMVVRDHNTRATNKTYLSCGTRAGTPGSKLAYLTNGTNGAAPYVGRASTSADTAVKPWLAAGCQLQVMGWRNGATGTPGTATTNTVGQRCAINRKSLNVTNQNATASAGFELGRNSATTTTSSTLAVQNVANGDWLTADIVEVIIFGRALTDAEFDNVMAAIADGYAIPDVTDQFVLDGDSRICSVLPTLPAENPAMVMTEPGAAYALPKTVRMINYAIGGATTIYGGSPVTAYGSGQSSLYGRLKYTADFPLLAGLSCLIPGGQNRIAIMAGHNDLSQTPLAGVTDKPAQIYVNLNSCIYNTSAPSYLTIGWDVTLVVEMHNNVDNYINGGGGYTSYRALQRSQIGGKNLLTDNNAGPGQTYDGKLRILDMPLMRSGGASVFETQADTANTGNYQNDRLHETAAGMFKFATGGDTPQYGLRAVWPA